MSRDFDPNPCRVCGGEGVTREKLDAWRYLAERCRACNGTGDHTVIVEGDTNGHQSHRSQT